MHSYFGRYRAGQVVSLALVTSDEDGNLRLPASLPRARIVILGPGAPGMVADLPMIPLGPEGEYGASYRIGVPEGYNRVFPGRYTVRMGWTSSVTPFVATAAFDVTPGGDPGGAVIALHDVRRPPRQYIVAHLDSGVLVAGSSPKA